MTNWAYNVHGKNALAAISTLKRVLGIPNLPCKGDGFVQSRLFIYVPDESSGQLLAELLYRYGTSTKGKLYQAHPEWKTIRDTIEIHPFSELGSNGGVEGYCVSMEITNASALTKSLEKMAMLLIAPDGKHLR